MAKNKITIGDILDVIPISKMTYNKYRKHTDMKELYKVFNDDNLATREKRTYLTNLQGLDDNAKEYIWDAYIGDSLYDCVE